MSDPCVSLQRVIGTTSEIALVYVQSNLVTSFPGLQNVFASTVSASWFRSDATGASTIAILSTAAMGTYSSGNWVQVNSTLAPGWYQFGVPNNVFASGRCAVLHIGGSIPAFSAAPIYFELTKTDNQTAVSTQQTNITRVYGQALTTSASGVLSVNVSTIQGDNADTSAPGVLTVDVSTIQGGNVVTSAPGVLVVGRVGVSSFNLPVGVSSFDSRVGVSSFGLPVGVSSISVPVNLTSIYGTPVVTSFAGVFTVGVSTNSDKTGYGVTGLNPALLDASVSSRLSAAGYTVPDNTNIANIQSKTSSLTYTVSGVLDSNVTHVNDVEIKGTGISGNEWGPV